MKIKHEVEANGTQTWSNDRNNGFICYRPRAAGSTRDSYVMARAGDGTFWCECHREFVYSFTSLVTGHSNAPAYMTRLAKRAAKDLKGGAA
jgi:hypothetical protein|tara:strand:+ start:270 stop:542 length:273 start_codon:yes stop_codon:yes gene_type:complete